MTKCNLVFSPTGDYLAVKVTRHTKSKKTLFNNIELFCLNQSGVPVEMLNVKDAVMALLWEPHVCGSRFVMIHAENPTASKVKVSPLLSRMARSHHVVLILTFFSLFLQVSFCDMMKPHTVEATNVGGGAKKGQCQKEGSGDGFDTGA